MTYYEAYSELNTIDEVKRMVKKDATVALLMGSQGRMDAIEEAMNKRIKELEGKRMVGEEE